MFFFLTTITTKQKIVRKKRKFCNADANASADAEMLMPRLPNGHTTIVFTAIICERISHVWECIVNYLSRFVGTENTRKMTVIKEEEGITLTKFLIMFYFFLLYSTDWDKIFPCLDIVWKEVQKQLSRGIS